MGREGMVLCLFKNILSRTSAGSKFTPSQRFSGSDTDAASLKHVEMREVPVNGSAVYFAFRDNGACVSILSLRVSLHL